MARTVDLFINHHDEHQLLVLVGTAVHQPPSRVDDQRWSVRLADGVVGDLGRTCSALGGGPRFRPFQWQLSARSDAALPAGDDPVAAAVRVVADDLRRQKLPCLVVLDLQHDARTDPGARPADQAAADGCADQAAEAVAPDVAQPEAVASEGAAPEAAAGAGVVDEEGAADQELAADEEGPADEEVATGAADPATAQVAARSRGRSGRRPVVAAP